MAERAAHLVEHVFPDVPVRQWVLTAPHQLRYLLAWNHGLTRAVVGVFMRGVLGWLRRRARVEQGSFRSRFLDAELADTETSTVATPTRDESASFRPSPGEPRRRWVANGSWDP